MIPNTVLTCVTIHFEDPDLLVTRATTDGLIDAEGVLAVAGAGYQVFSQREDIYWLSCNGKAKGVSPEARAVFKDLPVLRPYAYVGVVESFVTRAWVQLLMRGLVLIGRLAGKVVLFSTEEEARSWIAEDRSRRSFPAKRAS